jgi:hypothetical protein
MQNIINSIKQQTPFYRGLSLLLVSVNYLFINEIAFQKHSIVLLLKD